MTTPPTNAHTVRTVRTAHEPAHPQVSHRSFWVGRSEFVVVALLYVIAILLTVGITTMEVLGESTPGPRFFPIIVCVLLYVTATALAVHVLRHPKPPATDQRAGRGNFSTDMLHDLGQISDHQHGSTPARAAAARQTHSDWKTVGQIVGASIAFILLLKVLGWILCAAFLFWAVSRALGSKKPVFDVGVALLFSSAIQLAFNAGLGLPLPAGFIGGLF